MPFLSIKCPKCDASFKQEAKFIVHLNVVHELFDVEKLFVDTFHGGLHPKCECSIDCCELVKFSSWKKGFTSKYVRGHNARVYTAFSDPEVIDRCVEKRIEGFESGRNKVWNVGLSKQSNQIVANSAIKTSATLNRKYSTGELIDWRLLNPEKAKAAAIKGGITLHARYESGEIEPWNKGLTHETDDRLKPVSIALKNYFKQREAGRRISNDELQERVSKFENKFQLISSLDDYRKHRVEKLEFLCKNCNAKQMKSLAMLEQTPICFSCEPKSITSKGQQEVFDFVTSLGFICELNNTSVIKPKHIDVLIPSKNFAIEFNGCYYHKLNKDYHQQKLDACSAVGIKLLHVFDDEWRDKQHIVKSMIARRLGLTRETVNARSCSIVSLIPKEARSFFESNHLDGNVTAKIYLGLKDSSNRLVAAMSLRIPRQKQAHPDTLEVARCCSLVDVNVRGWLGKLTKQAIETGKELGYKQLMTYVDMRVGDGSSYLKTGWQQIQSSSALRFWWTDGNVRFDRFKYRADKSRGMSQNEVALEAGVAPIYGCKNLKFVIQL